MNIPDKVWSDAAEAADPVAELRRSLPWYIPEENIESEIKAYLDEQGDLDTYYEPGTVPPGKSYDSIETIHPDGLRQVDVHGAPVHGYETGRPFMYHAPSKTLYTGQENWLHWDMIHNHPDLMEDYGDVHRGVPTHEDYVHGRVRSTGAEFYGDSGVASMRSPTSQEREQIQGALGAQPKQNHPVWNDDDAWTVEEPSLSYRPESRPTISYSSYREAFDAALQSLGSRKP